MQSSKQKGETVLDVKCWLREKDLMDTLDDVIHEIHSQAASTVNNRGVDGQLDYLIGMGYSVKGIKDCVKEVTSE